VPEARRIALLVEYDGAAYGGSQYQKNAPTVQGTLEAALSSLTGEPIRVALAGRTDAGVHALGQVAAFTTASAHPVEVFVRGANAKLPRDVAVRAAVEVPAGFDPRRQALSRWYRYLIYRSGQRSPLFRNRAWQVPEKLDVEAMAAAAAMITGRHDFRAFAPPSEAARSTERVVSRACWSSCGRVLRFDIEGNAFLRNMVRRLVAALAAVGRGQLSAAAFARMIESPSPGEWARNAPPWGLYLMRVRYESGLFDDETNENI
jgi:tRNA pseudouridine38-40 synthase